MLILSRKVGQSIIIGGNIKVQITGYERGQVTIGIEAPRNISVHRSEIQDRVDRGETQSK